LFTIIGAQNLVFCAVAVNGEARTLGNSRRGPRENVSLAASTERQSQRAPGPRTVSPQVLALFRHTSCSVSPRALRHGAPAQRRQPLEVTVSKTVLLATEKPFSKAAREDVVAILKQAGYGVNVLESYKGKGPLLDAIASADAAIVRSDIIDAEVLGSATKLRLVVRAGAGYDNIDCSAAKGKGVAVMNTPGQNANAVAELVFGMLVYAARGKFNGKTGTELRGKTLGLHAFGAVGRAVSAIAKGFGMTVYAYDPFVPAAQISAGGAEPVSSLEDLYTKSRYVSLHIPATPETKGSIGKKLLSLLPPGGTVVNTARKEIINEPELLEVFAARSDVYYLSDIAPSDATLATLKEKYDARVYITPQKMGAQTEEANVNAGLAAARQIVGFFERGDKAFVVNP
jgi:D-3-phosphoglycerate dehydrogenase / 2-oxoglutarate reductase